MRKGVKIVTALGVIVVAAAAALILLVYVGDSDDARAHRFEGGRRQYPSGPSNPLATGNRDALEACVEFIDVDEISAEAVRTLENVSQAIKQAASHPHWLQHAGATDLAYAVVRGCPSGVPRIRAGTRDPIGGVHGHVVEVPSPYRVFVFILSDRDAQEFVGLSDPVAAQELTCSGDSCGEVTSGLYLGISEASWGDDLAEVIYDAVGLPPVEGAVVP